jgi:hypothetical protein
LDMWSSASLVNSTAKAATACCVFLLGACSHPIEIVGEGDIWSLAGRTCTLENYQASSTCNENYAVRDYQETYYATPRDGWRFDHWVNYCDTTPTNQCSFNVSASDVQKFWGKTVLPLRAVFVPEDVPIHGVGLQAHLGLQPPDGVLLQNQIARLTALGLRVELTELDIPLGLFADQSDSLQAQGIAYGKVFAACMAVPGCSGVTVWGLDDTSTWLDSFILTAANAPNRPLLFDEGLDPKPAYYLVRGLLEGH